MIVGGTKVPRAASAGSVGLMNATASGAHRRDMAFDGLLRFRADDRPNIDGEPVRPSDGKLLERAFQHGERAVGDLFLQAQHAQRGAALSGAVEGRCENIGGDLFRERGGIDDHRVLAARLGDERNRLAAWQQPLRKLTLDQPGHLGRAGEHDPAYCIMPGKSRADAAITRQELQNIGGNACLMQYAHALRRDKRRLLGGLRQNRIASHERRRDLAGEDRQREIPRADAGNRSKRLLFA